MIELAYLAAFALAAYGTGNFLLKLLKIRLKGFAEEAAISQTLGLAVFSYATLAAGMIGILSGKLFAIAVVALLLLQIKNLKKFLQELAAEVKKNARPRKNLAWLLYIAIAAFAVLNVIAAMAPPHSSDAIAYHLAMPKIFAEEGKITEVPYMIPSNYPLATEMLLLDGYLLSGGVLSEMTAAYIALLAALAVYAFTRRHFSRNTALLASAIFYTMPIVSVFNIRGFVDISTALYAMAALIMLFSWKENGGTAMLTLSGIFAGTAAATKISAYPIPAVLGISVIYTSLMIRRERLVAVAGNAAAFGIAAFTMLLPWLAKAYAYTGNPVYPLLYNLFGGSYLSEKLMTFWVEESLAFVGFGTSLADLALMPWNMTMHSSAYGELLGIGPVFLAFIPALLLLKKVDGKIKGILAIAAMLLLAWFYTAQSLRYIFFVYAMLAVAAAYTITSLMNEKGMRTLIGVAVLLTLAMNAAMWAGANSDELKVVAGITDKDEFLAQKTSNYRLLQYTNTLDNAKLCLYGEIRGYYSENDYAWCHPAYQGYIDFYNTNDSTELLLRMKEAGITHIVYDKAIEDWASYYASNELPTATSLMENSQRMMLEITANHTEKAYENDEGAVYRIKQ